MSISRELKENIYTHVSPVFVCSADVSFVALYGIARPDSKTAVTRVFSCIQNTAQAETIDKVYVYAFFSLSAASHYVISSTRKSISEPLKLFRAVRVGDCKGRSTRLCRSVEKLLPDDNVCIRVHESIRVIYLT